MVSMFAAVRWICDHQIKSSESPKHPLGVEELRRSVLVIWVPRSEFAGGGGVPAVILQQFSDFGAEFGILLTVFRLGGRRTGEEVPFAHAAEFSLFGINVRVAKELLTGSVSGQ